MATAISALVLVGCGSSSTRGSSPQRSSSPRGRTTLEAAVPHLRKAHVHAVHATVPHLRKAHVQAVQPIAGNVSQGAPAASAAAPQVATESGPDPAPTGPATVTRAPAKGAPTDAQVRAAIARFQLAVSRYHLDQLDFSGALLNPSRLPAGGWNVSIASVEIAYGHAVACGGIMRPAELGVANKTLPCGTMVTFRYSNRAARVPVIDRGPYIPGRMWDLSGAAAEALRFPGLGSVQWRIG